MKSDKELNLKAHALLEERGINIEAIADLVLHLQSKYLPDLTLDECIESVEMVLAIGFTNYGYLDKVKPGIIQSLDSKDGKSCHTFLDDIVGAIAAAAASRIAHGYPDKLAEQNR